MNISTRDWFYSDTTSLTNNQGACSIPPDIALKGMVAFMCILSMRTCMQLVYTCKWVYIFCTTLAVYYLPALICTARLSKPKNGVHLSNILPCFFLLAEASRLHVKKKLEKITRNLEALKCTTCCGCLHHPYTHAYQGTTVPCKYILGWAQSKRIFKTTQNTTYRRISCGPAC